MLPSQLLHSSGLAALRDFSVLAGGRFETPLGFKGWHVGQAWVLPVAVTTGGAGTSGWKRVPSSGSGKGSTSTQKQDSKWDALLEDQVPWCHTLSQVPFCCLATITLPPGLLWDGKQLQQRADTTSSSL